MTARVQSIIRPGDLGPEKGPTEESLAREFVAMHGNGWRFDHTLRAWYRWDGQRWARDECRLIVNEIAEHLRIAGAATKSPGIASTKTAKGVETFAASNPMVATTTLRWDADPWLLGTKSGTVDLRTGELQRATPDQLITKIAAVAPGVGEPVLWLRFLTEAVGGDVDMVAFLRRWCGYCLTGSIREHAFAFVHGPGGNGKSVFLNTLTGIMGDYAVTAPMETFADSRNDRHPTDLAMLKGARLVSASETERGRGWAEAKVKSMTGGDKIAARFMHGNFFEYQPVFKLLIVGNHAPSLRNVDEAMRRRLNIMPFIVKPTSPDRDLEMKLRREWPQILAWAIAGCVEWQNSGLARPAAVADATEIYFTDQDVFGQWLADRCECETSAWELPDQLYKSWCEYAREAGEHPGTNKDFKSALELRGMLRAKTGGIRVYRGLKLRVAMNDDQ